MKILQKVFLLLAFFSLSVKGESLSCPVDASRLDFILKKFADSLVINKCESGAVCVVHNGKLFKSENFTVTPPKTRLAKEKKYPLGNTSTELISLCALSMQEHGKLNSKAPLAKHCSLFNLKQADKVSQASIADLLSMKAGIDKNSDTLIPKNSSPEEIFEISSQFSPVSHTGSEFEYSQLSATLAAYGLTYIAKKTDFFDEKNMKKSFILTMKKYLFSKLDIEKEIGIIGFRTPLFPAKAFVANINAISKWLELETSKNPKISNFADISTRRLSIDSTRRNGMWLNSSIGKKSVQMCGDYFIDSAHLIAIFPEFSTAIDVFVRSQNKSIASETCAKTLDSFANSLEHNFITQKN